MRLLPHPGSQDSIGTRPITCSELPMFGSSQPRLMGLITQFHWYRSSIVGGVTRGEMALVDHRVTPPVGHAVMLEVNRVHRAMRG